MTPKFNDHFSGHAAAYADARPHYPGPLFDWLATLTREHDSAWDCGTGNGQTALGLIAHYREVIATDASREQIEHAFRHARIHYQVTPAESPGLGHAVDLVTVSQALHWFDRAAFYRQVRAALKPDGAIAVWCYGLCWITPTIDALVRTFYTGDIGDYWPPERTLIDAEYRTLEFPFVEIEVPAFTLAVHWTLTQFLAYLQSWSAVQIFMRQHGRDPVVDFRHRLEPAWGDPDHPRAVTWPLHLRAGKLPD